MPLGDVNDPNKDFINALTYLGKGPYSIGMPGGSDISVGAGPAPAPGVNVGSFGTLMGGGPAASGAVGAGGTGGDIIGLLQNALKFGGKASELGSKLTASGQPQGMDVLKDMAGTGEIGLGADTALQGLGTELPNTTLGATSDFSQLLKELQGSLGSSSLQDPTLELNLGGGLGGGTESSLSSGLGTAAAGAGGALGALNMEEAIRGLLSGTGSPSGEASQLGSGALTTYQALSSLFPEAFPSIGSALGIGADTAAAIAAGTAGTSAGTAGAAGAGSVAAGTAGAGPAAGALGVAAPVIVGLLGYMQQQEQLAAKRQAGRHYRQQSGPGFENVLQQSGAAGDIDPSQLPPELQQSWLDTVGRSFQATDPSKLPETGGVNIATGPLNYAELLANAGPNPSATGDNQAAMNQYGQAALAPYASNYEKMVYLLSQNPNLTLPTMELGGGKTADIQQAAKAYGGSDPYLGWYGALPNTPSPFAPLTPASYDYSQEGGPVLTQALNTPNPELGGQFSPEVLSSPYFAQEYWQGKGVTPQEAFLYGTGKELSDVGLLKGLPGSENLGAYDPATLYKFLLSQGMPDLGGGATAGAAPPGASGAPGGQGTPLPDVYQDLLKQLGVA